MDNVSCIQGSAPGAQEANAGKTRNMELLPAQSAVDHNGLREKLDATAKNICCDFLSQDANISSGTCTGGGTEARVLHWVRTSLWDSAAHSTTCQDVTSGYY